MVLNERTLWTYWMGSPELRGGRRRSFFDGYTSAELAAFNREMARMRARI